MIEKNEINDAAKQLSKLGAAKGGKARANVLSPEERTEIARKAVQTRWAKAGKPVKEEIKNADVDMAVIAAPQNMPDMPYSILPGELHIGNHVLPCHILNNHTRVLTQTGVINALGMSKGGSGGTGGDRLTKFIAGKLLFPYVSNTLRERTENPLKFKIPGSGLAANGYEATMLVDICESVLSANDEGVLQKQQEHIVQACAILIRSFAKVGIIALIDEATGFQKLRAKHALQLKLQAFIAEELQEWARMFPEEFWLELARLEGIHYSPRSRPLRWGKYIMMFVYDAIDGDIGAELRKKNPDPHYLKNHHQWLKKFGRDKVQIQIAKVVTIMKLCNTMDDFRGKFAKVFKKSTSQIEFDFMGV